MKSWRESPVIVCGCCCRRIAFPFLLTGSFRSAGVRLSHVSDTPLDVFASQITH